MKRTSLTINGRKVRDQPPVVGDYCWPPIKKNIDKPCAYEAASCADGPRTKHDRCGYTFCDNHLRTHIRRLRPMPPDAWRSLVKKLHSGLDLIAKNPKLPFPSIGVNVSETGRRQP